jgi:O-antigen ligase
MIAAPRFALDRFVTWIAILGVGLAVFGVVQRAVNLRSVDSDGWQLVYGFWKPQRAGNVFGPFINRNHFAGWMIMALPLVVGYACAVVEITGPEGRLSPGRGLRWTATPDGSRFLTLAAAALVMATSVAATGSRSGIAALVVMLLVFAYFIAARMQRRRARTLALGGLIAVLLGGIIWLGVGRTLQRFSVVSEDVGSRISAWHDSLRIIRDMPLFGTGAGGFGTAMLVYQREHRETFYAQAHNDYLQVLAEGGLLVGIPVFAAIGLLVWTIRLRLRNGDGSVRVHWIRAGAVAGLAAIAVQSLVDFSLQIPADTLLFVVIAAIAVHRPLRPRVTHAYRV